MRSMKFALSFVLCSAAVFAQSDRGTITGTVADPAGAIVAGAAVEAKSVDTGSTYPVATSGTGNYTISSLPPGNYDLTATVTGFKKTTRTGVQVSVATTVRIDFQLEVGATTDSVTVNAEAPMLKTESGELSHQVSYERADNLPLLTLGGTGGLGNVRNPLQVVNLLPGASFANDLTLRINGMPSSSQAIRIEGQDATNGFWRQQNQINQTSVDAIQEVAVQTSNFAAEYGQAGGGYFNYTMRSGTNQYHGSAFNYLQNEALNAGLPFTDAGLTNSQRSGQHIRNSQRRFDFGGTFGGPVVIPKLYNGRNKTFFFFNFEQFRAKSLTTGTPNTVPTDAFRNGDFSAALNPQLLLGGVPAVDALNRPLFGNEIFDPGTQRTVNGQIIRDQYANNVIPLTSLDPTALKMQALFPKATGTTGVNNYIIPSYFNQSHTTIPSLKIDHNLTSSIKISGFYSANRNTSPAANGYTQAFTSAEPTDILSQTTRINYDQTITPTLLMHLGAGYLDTSQTNLPPAYDQSQLFGSQTFYAKQFPNLTGIFDGTKGGFSPTVGVGFGATIQKDLKATFNNSFTWVHGNHTYKFGAEAIFEGLPITNTTRANGQFGFGQAETASPFSTGNTYSNGATGFGYASFLTGNYGSLTVSQLTTSRLGNHTLGFYAQDTWKVSRKLTLDYGLRYDYATLLSEQHGRMQDAAFHTVNPTIGRQGTVIYGNNCNCQLNGNYPWALGPRLGLAYKIDDKTVFRAGAGLAYGTSPNNAFLTYSVPDFYTYGNQAPAGVPAGQLKNANPFAPGNPFGNAPIVWPDFTPHYPVQISPGYALPQSPFISVDRNAGRLPRIFQWSIGFQREVLKGTVVDVAYVGNRGVWWTAPLLSTEAYNSLTPAMVKAAGLDPTNASDLALLTTPITSALVQARFPNLQIQKLPSGLSVVPSVYSSFPATQTLGQALRPYPQWNGVPPFLGPPLGSTWYDSLQMKVTKRYSHGLDAQYAFTYQKELANGANSDTSYLTPNPPLINDVFNYGQNKQISGFSRPLVSTVSLNYRTPGLSPTNKGMRALSWGVKDWVIGAVLRYQSGTLIRAAGSNNNFLAQLQRGATQNPALWGGGTTFQNQTGQPFFLKDPNCHCFDPTTTLVLNPAAWSDVGAGQFGTSAPYIDGYRWQRQPSEALSLGRIFPIAKEGKINLNVRLEFQNIFNRTFLTAPSSTNPTALTLKTNPFPNGTTGALSGGYGFVNSLNGFGATPRSGQIVARLQF
jgi:Carboxypeptidase regulatory-like domain/TonB dependent receptor